MNGSLRALGSLVGFLLVIGLVVAVSLSFKQNIKSANPLSPNQTPTQPFYPGPPAQVAPTGTPLHGVSYPPPDATDSTPFPKPTATSTPLPNDVTPTSLPLPNSAFQALWADNGSPTGGRLLLTDPRAPGQQRELLQLPKESVLKAEVSPNGRHLAILTTLNYNISRLWLASIDGSNLRQIEEDHSITTFYWSRNNQYIVYKTTWSEVPEGTPQGDPLWPATLVLLDVGSGTKQQLITPESDTSLKLLGWSQSGQQIYYSHYVAPFTYELWSVNLNGQNAHRLALLGREPSLVLDISPNGSRFLTYGSDGLVWISADDATHHSITQIGAGFVAAWAPEDQSVVVSEWVQARGQRVVRLVNVNTLTSQELGAIGQGGNWKSLGLSPNHQWLATTHEDGKLYWVHLPTGAITTPIHDKSNSLFVGWIPR